MLGTKEMTKAMKAAKFATDDDEMINRFIYYCDCSMPADKEMLPKMVALLREFRKSGTKINQWYFQMQECIKNHYRTQGNCFWFKDAKEILKGAKKFDVYEAVEKTGERIDNCIEFSGPFGEKRYL
jgi:hypothetical protein